jgi:nucleoside-diphosphate-sugar epimerase
VDDVYHQLHPEGGRYASLKRLSDSEVITLALFQQLRGIESEHSFLREIAEMVIELSRSGSELVHEPLPEDDPKRRCPDITRARETLGWEPRVPVREGLRKTIDWFAGRSNRTEASSARR